MPNLSPLFTVVIPLHDQRGVGKRAVRAWCEQRTTFTPFQIVVVDSGRKRLALEIAKELQPGDQVVSATGDNEAVLYNAGAVAALGEWIVFTESHVLPCDGTVAALFRRLIHGTTSVDAAVLGSSHGIRSRFAAVDAELCERESSQMRALGLWRAVGLRGFLIRQSVFKALGTFDERYFRFAETALAIHLIDRGYRLEEFADVVVQHFDTDSLSELLSAMALGRQGACRFWNSEPDLAGTFFRSPMPSDVASFIDPRIARKQWQAVASALVRRRWHAAHRLVSFALPTCFTALTGWRGEWFRVWLRVQFEYSRILWKLHVTERWNDPRQSASLVESYRKLRNTCAEIGAVRFRQEETADSPRKSLFNYRQIAATEFSSVGKRFFPCEVWEGETYCWSKPSAAIMLPLSSDEQQVILDVRPTGGWLVRRPQLFLNGQRIEDAAVTEEAGMVTVGVPADLRRPSASILSWRCQPFIPFDSGLPDRRRLGVALIRVEIRPTSRAGRLNFHKQAA